MSQSRTRRPTVDRPLGMDPNEWVSLPETWYGPISLVNDRHRDRTLVAGAGGAFWYVRNFMQIMREQGLAQEMPDGSWVMFKSEPKND